MDEILRDIRRKMKSCPAPSCSEPSCELYRRGQCKTCFCTECEQKGYIFTSREPLVTKYCDCQRKANNAAMLRRLGLGYLCERNTFESYVSAEPWQARVKELALRYAEERRGWFFIGGQSGSGKTHICLAILRRMIEKRGTLQYFRWVDDGRRLKALAGDSSRLHEIERYEKADILYIDDLFKGKVSDADLSLAFELLNAAYVSGQRVIISSELTISDINRYDPSIAGRIWERAGDFCINLSGKEKNQRTKRAVN